MSKNPKIEGIVFRYGDDDLCLREKVADLCELQIMKIKGSHSGIVRTEIIRKRFSRRRLEFWRNHRCTVNR